jgi:hypothetical protein
MPLFSCLLQRINAGFAYAGRTALTQHAINLEDDKTLMARALLGSRCDQANDTPSRGRNAASPALCSVAIRAIMRVDRASSREFYAIERETPMRNQCVSCDVGFMAYSPEAPVRRDSG